MGAKQVQNNASPTHIQNQSSCVSIDRLERLRETRVYIVAISAISASADAIHSAKWALRSTTSSAMTDTRRTAGTAR